MVPIGADRRVLSHYDVVGPVCEGSDALDLDRALPRCVGGDLVAIAGAGAYGGAMSSAYNSRPLAAEAMVDAGRYAVVRRRQRHEDMVAGEQPADDWKVVA